MTIQQGRQTCRSRRRPWLRRRRHSAGPHAISAATLVEKGSIEGSARHDALAPLFPVGTVFPFDSDSETGFVYGGQLGCAWQTGQFVWGIEGDFNGTDISRDSLCRRAAAPRSVPAWRQVLHQQRLASVDSRPLGLGLRSLPDLRNRRRGMGQFQCGVALVPTLVSPALFASRDKTLTGWTVGGGFEWAFTPNWSLGVEYRFSQFDGDENSFNRLVAAGTLLRFASQADLETPGPPGSTTASTCSACST